MNHPQNKISQVRAKLKDNLLLFGYTVCKHLTPEKTSCPLHKDIAAFHHSDEKYLAIIAPRGHAKYIELSQKVLTTRGWVSVGELVEGDYVYGSDGKPKKIIGFSDIVYKEKMYKVTTRDGRSLVVSDDHLWTVKLLNGLDKNTYRTYTTAELVEKRCNRPRKDKRYGKINNCFMFGIEQPKAIEFPEKDLPVDPYCLGALIGNGGLINTTPRVNLNDNCYSKHIPDIYLNASVEQRLALLQGLMDANGTTGSRKSSTKTHCNISFTTVSQRLADDVVYLVRSLGGRATKSYNKNKRDYHIGVHVPFNPFRLKRKAKKYSPPQKTWNAITSIEPQPGAFCRCIKVDSEDELFVANDFLLTHNTTWASTIATLHDVAYDRESVIVLVKKTFTLATTDLANIINEVRYNKLFRQLYGERVFLIDRQEKVFLLNPVTGHKTWIEVKGAEQSIRGIVVGGKRITKFLLDDFEDENNTQTPEQRGKVRQWMSSQIMPSIEPKTGKILAIGTIVHYDSWLCNLWQGYERAKKENRPFSWRVIYHQIIENGKPIFPERFTPEYIEALRQSYEELGRIDSFFMEYYNIPFNKDDAHFSPSMVKHYNGIFEIDPDLGTILVVNNEKIPVNVVVGIDPSSGTAHDYTGISVIGIDKNNNRYVIDANRYMIKPDELVEKVFFLNKTYKPLRIVIEDQAMQVIMTYWLRSEMIKRNEFIPLVGIKVGTRVKKEERLAQALQPMYSSGVMYHRQGLNALEEELFSFPKGKYDDILDSLYNALKYASPASARIGVKKEKKKTRSFYDWMTGAKRTERVVA